jgi:mycothiol synthase
VIRPFEDRDLAPTVDLFNELSRALYGTGDTTEAELRVWLTSPGVVPARDIRVVGGPDGRLAGYADVFDQNEWHTRYWCDVRVHPELGDTVLAAMLVAWSQERARQDAKEGAFLRSFVRSKDEQVARAFEAAGFPLIRHSYRMEIELGGEPRHPEWPEGLVLRPMRAGEERAVYEANEECFADHWEHVEEPYEEWRHWTVDREDLDPSLWFLALAGGEIAGYSLCRMHDAEPGLGWVDSLGVRRPSRRRGLGRALLEHSFEELRRRGAERVGLGVDAESLTGANRLYERAGMHVSRLSHVYERSLQP